MPEGARSSSMARAGMARAKPGRSSAFASTPWRSGAEERQRARHACTHASHRCATAHHGPRPTEWPCDQVRNAHPTRRGRTTPGNLLETRVAVGCGAGCRPASRPAAPGARVGRWGAPWTCVVRPVDAAANSAFFSLSATGVSGGRGAPIAAESHAPIAQKWPRHSPIA